jgi:uncharacterized damage-inducible protein DinB
MNAAQFFDHWNIVHRDLMRALAILEDQDLDFKPAKEYDRTVGDILRHIINTQRGWIHYVIRQKHDQWPEEDESALNSVDAIQEELSRVFIETMDYLVELPADDFNRIVQIPDDGTPKLGWILWHVFEQQVHHRGELFLCLSLLGKRRPKIDRPG